MNHKVHNIIFPDGTQSNQSGIKPTAETRLWMAAKETIDFFIPDKKGLTAVDLGCLEGGHSVELAKMGFDTIGIEVRQDNFNQCLVAKQKISDLNLSFAHDDARNILNYGQKDVVFCSGILYHLNDPVNMINLMAKTCKNLLIINTHVAPEKGLRYKLGWLNNKIIAPIQKRIKVLNYRHNYRLSPITKNEGYRGRWYKEYDKKANRNKIERAFLSSYNNYRSFWLCKDELVRALKNTGFKIIFEKPDFSEDIGIDYKNYYHRCMIVAKRG